MTTVAILTYNLALLGGTAYYVFERGVSPWWFLLTVICLMGSSK